MGVPAGILGAGIGGGGGAPGGADPLSNDPGIGGGGGGGAGGAAVVGIGGGGGAPKLGIGGGGGGALGAPSRSDGGGIGGAEGGADGVDGLPNAGDLELSSIADNGLGGAMVPNSMEANCLALPPVGLSSLSSSEELSPVESTTDHSSSSGRWREGREPVGVAVSGVGGGLAAASFSCCAASRWKGFVDTSAGDVIDEVGWVEGVVAGSLAWLSFLKKGFFVSLLIDDDGPRVMGANGGLAAADSDGVNVAAAEGSGAAGLLSLERT